MNKKAIISIVFLAILLLQSCSVNKNYHMESSDSPITISSIDSNQVEISQQTESSNNPIITSSITSDKIEITQQQAINIVKEKLGKNGCDLGYDIALSLDKKYWDINTYYENTNGGILDAFMVDVSDGSLYERFLDILIPLNNVVFMDESFTTNNGYGKAKEYSENTLMKYLNSNDIDAYSYFALIKRADEVYYVVAYFVKSGDGCWEFYLINKSTNKINKWDLQNDKILSLQ